MKKIYFLFLILLVNLFFVKTIVGQGIGITDASSIVPQSLLHIHQGSATGTLFQLTNTTSDNTSQTNGFIINFNTNFKAEFKNQYNNSSAGISFFTNNGSITEKLTILNNGNVGIGSINPISLLDVDGTFKLGTNGTISNAIIKATVNLNPASCAARSTVTVTSIITNAVMGASVIISPATNLTSGFLIAYAYISSANTVTVGFVNATGSSINEPAHDYYITIIQ